MKQLGFPLHRASKDFSSSQLNRIRLFHSLITETEFETINVLLISSFLAVCCCRNTLRFVIAFTFCSFSLINNSVLHPSVYSIFCGDNLRLSVCTLNRKTPFRSTKRLTNEKFNFITASKCEWPKIPPNQPCSCVNQITAYFCLSLKLNAVLEFETLYNT